MSGASIPPINPISSTFIFATSAAASMTRSRTLRARFVFWMAGLLFVALTVFGVYVYVSMSHSLLESLDDALAFSASQVAATIEINEAGINQVDGLEGGRSDLLDHESAIRIVSQDGRVLFQAGLNFGFPQMSAIPKTPEFSSFTSSTANQLVRTY